MVNSCTYLNKKELQKPTVYQKPINQSNKISPENFGSQRIKQILKISPKSPNKEAFNPSES